MKNEYGLLCSVLTLASCAVPKAAPYAAPWKNDSAYKVILPDVAVMAGGHCESSAMMNALRFAGYDVSECMIIGGGGAPSFIHLKGTFPFIGARCEDMRERFFDATGIQWHNAIPEGKDAGWTEIRSLLERGIPVVLRVDMRYLPYRYGGKYGSKYMSFGGHYVTLFGIDSATGLAYVSDTEYAALQAIKLVDLHKARRSDTKTFPPRAEYYWVEPSSVAIDADSLVRASLKAVIENYESLALDGLSRYGADLASIESYSRQKFLLPSVFAYMAGNIEEHGTGGASFRMPYRDFLLYAAGKSSFANEASDLIPYLDECIASWHQLSSAFRDLSLAIKGMDAGERAAEYARLEIIAQTLYEREKAFYTEMRKSYMKMTGA
jgi:hypothetical protein